MPKPLANAIAEHKAALDVLFRELKKHAYPYWSIRHNRAEAEFDHSFAEHVMTHTKNDSDDDGMYNRAVEDFNDSEEYLEESLETFLSKRGGYFELRKSIQTHTNAIVDVVTLALKRVWSLSNPDDLSRLPEGKLIESIPLKELLWYTRNYVHHHAEGKGPAKNKMLEFKERISQNIADEWHWVLSGDFESHFRIDKNENVSDEVVRIIGWRKYEDVLNDMTDYERT